MNYRTVPMHTNFIQKETKTTIKIQRNFPI